MLGAEAETLAPFAQPGEGSAVVAHDVNTAGDGGSCPRAMPSPATVPSYGS